MTRIGPQFEEYTAYEHIIKIMQDFGFKFIPGSADPPVILSHKLSVSAAREMEQEITRRAEAFCLNITATHTKDSPCRVVLSGGDITAKFLAFCLTNRSPLKPFHNAVIKWDFKMQEDGELELEKTFNPEEFGAQSAEILQTMQAMALLNITVKPDAKSHKVTLSGEDVARYLCLNRAGRIVKKQRKEFGLDSPPESKNPHPSEPPVPPDEEEDYNEESDGEDNGVRQAAIPGKPS